MSGTKTPATMKDAIASEVAAEAAHYLLTMYPTDRPGTHPAMLRSLRAHITADMLQAMRLSSEEEARAWIDRRARHRREVNRLRRIGAQGEAVRGDPAAADALVDALMAPQEIDNAE